MLLECRLGLLRRAGGFGRNVPRPVSPCRWPVQLRGPCSRLPNPEIPKLVGFEVYGLGGHAKTCRELPVFRRWLPIIGKAKSFFWRSVSFSFSYLASGFWIRHCVCIAFAMRLNAIVFVFTWLFPTFFSSLKSDLGFFFAKIEFFLNSFIPETRVRSVHFALVHQNCDDAFACLRRAPALPRKARVILGQRLPALLHQFQHR